MGVSVVWTVVLYPPCAPSQQGVVVRNACHCAAVAPVVEVPAAVRSPLVVPVLAPTPGVLDSLHLSSRHRAVFVLHKQLNSETVKKYNHNKW